MGERALDDDEVARLRVAVMRLARDLRGRSAEEGLTPAQSGVLATLVRTGPMKAGDLASAESLNPTMLSRVLAHLEDQGLARRRADDDDRRCAWAEATPAGRRLVKRLRARHVALLSARLEGLAPDAARALVEALPALEAVAGDSPWGARDAGHPDAEVPR